MIPYEKIVYIYNEIKDEHKKLKEFEKNKIKEFENDICNDNKIKQFKNTFNDGKW